MNPKNLSEPIKLDALSRAGQWEGLQRDAWCKTVSTSPMVPPRSGKELLSLPPDEAAKLCKQKISVMRDALIRAHDGLTCDRSTDINWTYVWDQLTRAQVAVGTAVVVATGKMNPDREFEEMDTAEFKSIHDTPFVAGPIDSSPEGGAA